MIEIWKDISGYEGFYQVSNTGNIKSLERLVKTGKSHRILFEKLLKPCNSSDGYSRVILNKRGVAKSKLVHRLVADAFIENPNKKNEVNHVSGNKNDNSVQNLEWNTAKENINHAFLKGLKTGNFGQKNHRSKIVLNTETGIFYESAKDAIKSTNYDYVYFAKQLAGKRLNNTSFIFI